MANLKITELAALTAPVGEDLLAIVDDPSGTPVTKKVTLTDFNQLFVDLTTAQTVGGLKSFSAAVTTFIAATISPSTGDAILTLDGNGSTLDAVIAHNAANSLIFRGDSLTTTDDLIWTVASGWAFDTTLDVGTALDVGTSLNVGTTLDVLGAGDIGGTLTINDYVMPAADGTADQFITTDGLGALTFNTFPIPDGTTDGDMLYWDQTTTQAYAVTADLQWDNTESQLKFNSLATDYTIGELSSGTLWGITNSTHELIIFSESGATIEIQEELFRLDESQSSTASNILEFLGGTSTQRYQLKTDTSGYLSIGNQNTGPTTPGAKFEFPVWFEAQPVPDIPPSVVLGGSASIFSAQYNASSNCVLVTQNQSSEGLPIGNPLSRIWAFNTPTTAGDPTSGFFRVNNVLFSAASELYIDDRSFCNTDEDNFMNLIQVGDILSLQQANDSSIWLQVPVVSITDNTGWWTIVFTAASNFSGTVFTNTADVQFTIIPASLITAGSVTVVGTPVDNQLAVWTSASAIEGDADLTWDGSQLLLPLANDAVTPTFSFGDGDSGFYESADDTIKISIAGTAQFNFISTRLQGEVSTSGAILNTATSTVIPTLCPSKGDLDTGIGRGAVDELSLIAGGVQAASLSEAAGVVQMVVPLQNSATAPSIAFGDGDSGFYEETDDNLRIAIAGVQVYNISSGFIFSDTTAGGALRAAAATSTSPALTFAGDTDTGIGKTAADQLSLIAGGVQVANLTEAAGVIQMILPLQDVAATPSLAFGDGDTGFYESVDDQLRLSNAGTDTWFWTTTRFAALATDGPMMANEVPSATNPTLIPARDDLNTGIGHRTTDVGVLIAGAQNCIEFGETGGNPRVGFYGTAHAGQQTVTGSRAGNAALASLLTGLATSGLIVDSSTA